MEDNTMRQEFIETETGKHTGELYDAASEQCPWAARITKVEGGYMAFESLDDYYTWTKQI
jgi:hypothetical protein